MMNERIKELAKDAGVLGDWGENASEGRFFITGNTKQMEKFALLIVRECAEICKKQEYDYWRSSEDQDFTPQDCADAIEQHFGVE